MTTHLVTGAAGFIGVNLVERLLQRGCDVIMVDDLSLGTETNLLRLCRMSDKAYPVRVNCGGAGPLLDAVTGLGLPGITDVWHLAANSDISAGLDDPRIDIDRTFLTTAGVISLVRGLSPARIHFASSSAVYGDHGDALLTEDAAALHPISYYGAMKLASEAILRASVEAFIPQANVLRFANIVGAPATHGAIFDFIGKLRQDPSQLTVLGDGSQRKPYLHVAELVDALIWVADHVEDRFNVVNVGPMDDGIAVAEIARIVADTVAPSAELKFGTAKQGWIGDVPMVRLSSSKLQTLGWTAQLSSVQAVSQAVADIVSQENLQ